MVFIFYHVNHFRVHNIWVFLEYVMHKDARACLTYICFWKKKILLAEVSQETTFLRYQYKRMSICSFSLHNRCLCLSCFSSLRGSHILQMEWSLPEIRGDLVTPRAGHAGIAIDENWYIVGGGDNKNGMLCLVCT